MEFVSDSNSIHIGTQDKHTETATHDRDIRRRGDNQN